MKLKDWLAKNNLSQVEFARMLNDSPQNVSRYVNEDGRVPEPSRLQRIVDLTNGEVDANDFCNIVLPKPMPKQNGKGNPKMQESLG